MIAACPKRITKMDGKGKEKVTEEYNTPITIQVEPQKQQVISETNQSLMNPLIGKEKGKQVIYQQNQPQDMEWQIVKAK